MTRVLVTGATGLVGGAALEALAAGDGVQVVAYVRDPGRLRPVAPNVTVEVGDLRDHARLTAALAGVDAVVLVSGHGRDMVEVQQAALATIGASGIRRVVKISGSPVATAADSASSIGRDHVDIEGTLRGTVPEPVVIRPNVFMQNFLAMAPAVAHGVLPGPEGDPVVSFVDAVDVGRAASAAALATSARSRIEITGAEALSYSQAAQTLSQVLGRSITYAPIPVDVMRQGLEAAGDPAWLAEHKVEMAGLMGAPQAALVTDHFAELVSTPPTSLKAFLTAHARTFEAAA
jgi:uncharacterized protein YbjT (DUF2867 family)